MRINEHVCVRTSRLILVPYEARHVLRYHEWMKSPELLEKTASEPLSLDQEYEMQRSWREDDDKLTFILLDRAAFDSSKDPATRDIDSMIGDVNVYVPMSTAPDEHADEGESVEESGAEVEVMLAEPSSRGKGLGREAVVAMMAYARTSGALPPHIDKFTSKIGFDNVASIRLFEKLGFKESLRSEVFREVTLTLPFQTFDADVTDLKESVQYSSHSTSEILS